MSATTLDDLFPLAAPRLGQQRDLPAERLVPFGLRFAGAPAPHVPVPELLMCPRRQIALTPEGEPWHRTVVAMTMKTSGPSSDGGPSTGGEEYSPDHHADETAGQP